MKLRRAVKLFLLWVTALFGGPLLSVTVMRYCTWIGATDLANPTAWVSGGLFFGLLLASMLSVVILEGES
jgi:hypothetical protein